MDNPNPMARNALLIFCGTVMLLVHGCASNNSVEPELEISLVDETAALSDATMAGSPSYALPPTNQFYHAPMYFDGPVLRDGAATPDGHRTPEQEYMPLPYSSKPQPPADTPAEIRKKEWEIRLKPGSQLAVIDGVNVYLSQPAIPGGAKGGKGRVSKTDDRLMLSPLKNAHTAPLAKDRPFRVFIDPGHGGGDPGARSRDLKFRESDAVMDISKRLAEHLRNAGFEVMLSRTDEGRAQTLDERTRKAARWRADAFVSIHLNANTQSSPNGFETYILPAQGMLSTSVEDPTQYAISASNVKLPGNANDVRNMQLGFAIQRRSLKTTGFVDRGLRRARFNVLREARMPAVLVECGFISSSKDLKTLSTSGGRERIARGIYQGICDYAYGTMEPGLAAHPVIEKNADQPIAVAAVTKPEIAPAGYVAPGTALWTQPSYAPTNAPTNSTPVAPRPAK